jgi:predicted DNA-binding transcriptional regulator YafY
MPDETTATRLLRLLPLLTSTGGNRPPGPPGSRHTWAGGELADRLGVTPRTIRRDIDRLRDLGYEIRATPGAHGGYTLGPGTRQMPPLLLDDDAAVAVAIALAAVPTEAAARAAAAIDQVLPARLRHRAEAVTAAAVPLPAPAAHQNDLAFLAQACNRNERLRFQYSDGAGSQTSRHVEPYRLVSTGRRWYLVARDIAKGEWRSFRLDRITQPRGTGIRSLPADPPDPAKFVSEGISSGPYRWRAKALLAAPAAEVAARVPATVAVIEALDDHRCLLTTGGHDLDYIAMHLASLDIPFTPLEPPELRTRCALLASRLSQAATSPPPPETG